MSEIRNEDAARNVDDERDGRADAATRRPWTPPEIEQLPRLTDLTLQSGPFGSPIGGGPSVF